MTELNTNSQQASWVDARTACELLNISYKTLKNKCYLIILSIRIHYPNFLLKDLLANFLIRNIQKFRIGQEELWQERINH